MCEQQGSNLWTKQKIVHHYHWAISSCVVIPKIAYTWQRHCILPRSKNVALSPSPSFSAQSFMVGTPPNNALDHSEDVIESSQLSEHEVNRQSWLAHQINVTFSVENSNHTAAHSQGTICRIMDCDRRCSTSFPTTYFIHLKGGSTQTRRAWSTVWGVFLSHPFSCIASNQLFFT